MEITSRPRAKQKNNRPDFENNLADFQVEFFQFVAESDSNFDLNLLRNNTSPSLLTAPAAPTPEVMYPVNKQELSGTVRVKGPRTVKSDIFGEQVVLEDKVRVKGNVYGVKRVEVGANCTIEGDLISDGALVVQSGCKVEGSLIGADIELEGSLIVEGPIYSRGILLCKGKLTGQSLTAGGNIVLVGGAEETVIIEASTIVAWQGEIQLGPPLTLGGRLIDPAQQKFYLMRSQEQLRLSRIPFEQLTEQGSLLTTLTDAELEKLVAELAVME